MTVIGFARTARRDRERSSHRGAPQITPLEARLLMLRTAGSAVATLSARQEDPLLRSSKRSGLSVRAYASVAFWLIMLAIIGAGYYVIDQGGHAVVVPSQAVAPRSTASGTGKVPVTVEPGDVMVRVTVRSAAVPWFWCLESSRGLPWQQHLCRDSGTVAMTGQSVATDGVVHLDAVSVQGATFFVQMYCRDACDWRADAEHGPP